MKLDSKKPVSTLFLLPQLNKNLHTHSHMDTDALRLRWRLGGPGYQGEVGCWTCAQLSNPWPVEGSPRVNCGLGDRHAQSQRLQQRPLLRWGREDRGGRRIKSQPLPLTFAVNLKLFFIFQERKMSLENSAPGLQLPPDSNASVALTVP